MKTYKKTKKNPLNAKRKTKKYGGGSRAAFADSSLPTTPIVKSLQPLQKAGYHHCLKLTSVINPRLPKQFTDCVFTLKAVQKGDILKIWNILPSNQKSFYSGHISVEIERGNRSYSFGFCGKGDKLPFYDSRRFTYARSEVSVSLKQVDFFKLHGIPLSFQYFPF